MLKLCAFISRADRIHLNTNGWMMLEHSAPKDFTQYTCSKMSEFSVDFILNRAGERYLGTNASLGILKRIKLHDSHEAGPRQGSTSTLPQLQTHQLRNGINLSFATPQHQQQQAYLRMPCHDRPEQLNLSLPSAPMFDWLHYTRYHPPKLPRSFRAGGLSSKRTPGRLPRIPFTPAQLDALEKSYQQSNYLSAEDANKLAQSLDLTSTRVKIWYQNRRARERRERREKVQEPQEEDYASTVSSNTSSPPPSSPSNELIKSDADIVIV